MSKVHWRKVRVGTEFEKEDRDHNERCAEQLLGKAEVDDFAVALDLCGYRIVPLAGYPDRWPLIGDFAVICSDWCVSAAEQQREITRLQAVASGGGAGRRPEA